MKDNAAVLGIQDGEAAADMARLESAWTTIRTGLRRDIGAPLLAALVKIETGLPMLD